MKSFSFQDRAQYWDHIEDQIFDLVIIGGGINGAGIARDAAMRGMNVVVVEASDFASGTSSRSSKMIHGGIRYLENMEFHLVFEALNERTKLFSMAPNLVHPLRFMIPLYEGGRVGMFKMGMGMWLYDALALFQAPELHERLSTEESVQRQPSLQKKHLLGSYVYSDAYMDDDRLVFETLRSANQYGAMSLSYCRAEGVNRDASGKIESIVVEDQITKTKKHLRGKHFVSTVGAWTDILNQKLKLRSEKVLRPTKGVHLTFDKSRLPLTNAVVMGAESRVVFGIPRHDMVIVGTTDTDYDGDPGQVSTTAEDVSYLLAVVDQYFPGAKIQRSDILSTYAGVRPLVDDRAENEGKTSREHSILSYGDNFTYIVGGKYTTYRLIAQQAVDSCLQSFPFEDRVKFRHSPTDIPLNEHIANNQQSIADLCDYVSQLSRWPNFECELFVNRHHAEAPIILKRQLSRGIKEMWPVEAAHAIENTMCLSLVDFYVRRTHLFLSMADHGISLLPAILPVFQSLLGWSQSQAEKQTALLHRYIQHENAWRGESKI